ncbi:AAA family ATPase [Acuticoccus sediminis]|uniref:AAA family ATPase n=1 Tax=Acuticoccus sediminis TaxID=2184697 RepID=UPI001CFCCB9C|nr:ATP-binding protein [Acuticoccus sediminis]
MTIEFRRTLQFVPTKAHARFVEFAEACAEYRYIGVCHGRPGVGKTRSAQTFAAWSLDSYEPSGPPPDASMAARIKTCRAVFYTARVANTPKSVSQGLYHQIYEFGHARLALEGGHDKHEILVNAANACPLVIVDEADRLSLASLEHLRDLYDRNGFGPILMGMPGLEKRLARYPQLYSRIGFVHEFKPLGTEETRFLFAKHEPELGLPFDPDQLDDLEAVAAIIRITQGNFRLIERLVAQMRRIMALNRLDGLSADLVAAARDCLVIGSTD